MKRPSTRLRPWHVLSACLALLAACGSGITAGGVPSADYNKYLMAPPGTAYRLAPEVLLARPHRPYVIVGLIEVRTLRAKPVDVLIEELRHQGKRLRADAVIPGEQTTKPEAIAAVAGPYRAYYVFDDGRSQVLQALAIRYPY